MPCGSGKMVVVASTNPVKREATRSGFRRALPNEAIEVVARAVPSGVGSQPFSDAETLAGAEERARSARALEPNAAFWVGIEGGVEERDGRLAAFAWVVVLSADRVGRARTGTFFLPSAVADLVRQGVELGDADDRVFGRTDSKRDLGAIGLLTGGVIDRTALYEHAVVLALVPFRNDTLYPPETKPQ
ncbi:MAG: inosine/xanthosine triphosphatase [Candidatus Bipolaricaulota bacterium]|nr:inosine/xanthosine triphosphatase [Candidatus Bipolaricaulota bacterium]